MSMEILPAWIFVETLRHKGTGTERAPSEDTSTATATGETRFRGPFQISMTVTGISMKIKNIF